MITKEQNEKIRDFAVNLDWELSFGGKSRGNRHLFRIVTIAKSLACSHKTDISIVEAGAWLHDTNLEKTIVGGTLENAEKVVAFLKSINVSESDIAGITGCIESHDGRVPATTMEAKIVHDADTLEKMGPLGVIRETWKRSQLGWNTEKIVSHLKKHMHERESRLYTEEAKMAAARLNGSLERFFMVIDEQMNEEISTIFLIFNLLV